MKEGKVSMADDGLRTYTVFFIDKHFGTCAIGWKCCSSSRLTGRLLPSRKSRSGEKG